MPDRVQDLLKKVRPPRVKITYDVEHYGSQKAEELPFVVGILADLAGSAAARADVNAAREEAKLPPLPPRHPQLADRNFIQIANNTFDDVLKKISPVVQLSGFPFNTDKPLLFEKYADFDPYNVAMKIDDLKTRIEQAQNLADLRSKADASRNLKTQLITYVSDDERSKLQNEVLISRAVRDAYTLSDAALRALPGINQALNKVQKELIVVLNDARALIKAYGDDDSDPAKDAQALVDNGKGILEELESVYKDYLGDNGFKALRDEAGKVYASPNIEDVAEDSNPMKVATFTLTKERIDDALAVLSGEPDDDLPKIGKALEALGKIKLAAEIDKARTAVKAAVDPASGNQKDAAAQLGKSFDEAIANLEAALNEFASVKAGIASASTELGGLKNDPNGTLQTIINGGGLNRFGDFDAQLRAQAMLGAFSDALTLSKSDPDLVSPTELLKWMQQVIEKLDTEVNENLSGVLHHPDFQKLEATWRGLFHLVSKTNSSTSLILRVLDITKDELARDMKKGEDANFDQTELFKKVYEAEYDTLGGTPYGLLVGDFTFNATTYDVEILTGISRVAAASFAPFLAAVDARFFGLDSFEDITEPYDIAQLLSASDYIKWRSFRDLDESRYVTLTLPRFLLRAPYGPDSPADKLPNFVEHVWKTVEKSKDTTGNEVNTRVGFMPDAFLWGNTAFALAQRITNSFFNYGWFAFIRGVEGGGRLENLPIYNYTTFDGDQAVLIPTEAAITDRREFELSNAGFVAVCYRKQSDYAVFFGGQTTHQADTTYFLDLANANERISARLPYIMAACRFAHYIKVNVRNKVGSFMTAQEMESYLNNWMAQYILLTDTASDTTKAQYPLRAGKVEVTVDSADPGRFNAVVYLQPHFQLEELTASLRLVTQIPAQN